MIKQTKYRLDIQALRGLAVLMVLLFHASESLFPLGYLGVDVFFVISGFVVTPLIVRIFAQDNLGSRITNLQQFYTRRFYRLAPALAVTLLFSSILILFLGDLSDHKNFARQGIATILLVGNLGAYKYSGDYFTPNPNPLIHTWSLSVEEQIYIFLPIFLLLTLHNRKSNSKIMSRSLIFLTVASFMLLTLPPIFERVYLYLDIQSPSLVNFYSPLTRIWQFTVGGLLQMLIQNRKYLNKPYDRPINLALLAGLIIVVIKSEPSSLLLSSCFATLFSILVINFRTMDVLPRVLRQGLVWLGDRSYSIYLVHMPIMYLAKYSTATSFSTNGNRTIQICIAIFASIAIGSLSFSKVENRFRQIEVIQHKKGSRTPILFVLLALLFFVAIYLAQNNNYWNLLKSDQQDAPPFFGNSHLNCLTNSDLEPSCTYLQKGSTQHVLLVGDSHAFHYAQAIALAAKDSGWTANVWTKNGCAVQLKSTGGKEVSQKCIEINTKMVDWVESKKPDLVIVSQYVQSNSSQTDLRDALVKIKALVPNVLMIENSPVFPDGVFDRPILLQLFNSMPAKQVPITQMDDTDSNASKMLSKWARSREILTLDVEPIFCKRSICTRYSNEGWLYTDQHHLSTAGANLVLPKFKFFLEQFSLP